METGEISTAIVDALIGSTTAAELVAALELRGLEVELSRRATGINGWKIRPKATTTWLRGSTLRRDLSWSMVAKRLAANAERAHALASPATPVISPVSVEVATELWPASQAHKDDDPGGNQPIEAHEAVEQTLHRKLSAMSNGELTAVRRDLASSHPGQRSSISQLVAELLRLVVKILSAGHIDTGHTTTVQRIARVRLLDAVDDEIISRRGSETTATLRADLIKQQRDLALEGQSNAEHLARAALPSKELHSARERTRVALGTLDGIKKRFDERLRRLARMPVSPAMVSAQAILDLARKKEAEAELKWSAQKSQVERQLSARSDASWKEIQKIESAIELNTQVDQRTARRQAQRVALASTDAYREGPLVDFHHRPSTDR